MKDLINVFDLTTFAYFILALAVVIIVLWMIERFTVDTNFQFDKFKCNDEAICTFSGHVVLILSKCNDPGEASLYNVLYKTGNGTLKIAKLPEAKLVKIKPAGDKPSFFSEDPPAETSDVPEADQPYIMPVRTLRSKASILK